MATSSTQEGGDEGTDVTYTEWIDVQKKTFTNWVNEKLKDTPYKVEVLEKDLDDGVTLIKLLEALAHKKMHKRYTLPPSLPPLPPSCPREFIFWKHFRLRLFFKAEVHMHNCETTPLQMLIVEGRRLLFTQLVAQRGE